MTRTAPAGPAVVVGGGILGVSTAHQLARRGAAVTLVSDASLASGASGRSLAWLNSAAIHSEEYHRLRLLGIDRHRTLAARHGAPRWLRFDGGLRLGAADGADEARLRAMFAYERTVGYAADWLTAEEVPAVTPGVDPSTVPTYGALFNPGEGWVHLPSLIELLADELVALGGEVVTDAGPATILTGGDRVRGVRTESGRVFDASTAVLATGADVPGTLRRLGVPIGERTSLSVLVRTARVELPLRAVLNTPRVSIRPTPDGALVLDSGWSENEVIQHEDGKVEVLDSTVRGLLDEASAVLAGAPRLPFESYGAGRKPIPGDGEPVLGRVDGIAGYHVAFTHSGATLGLIAGELLADEIITGEPHPLLAGFRPDRFV